MMHAPPDDAVIAMRSARHKRPGGSYLETCKPVDHRSHNNDKMAHMSTDRKPLRASQRQEAKLNPRPGASKSSRAGDPAYATAGPGCYSQYICALPSSRWIFRFDISVRELAVCPTQRSIDLKNCPKPEVVIMRLITLQNPAPAMRCSIHMSRRTVSTKISPPSFANGERNIGRLRR